VEDAVDVQEDACHRGRESTAAKASLARPSGCRVGFGRCGHLRSRRAAGEEVRVEPVADDREGDTRIDADEGPHFDRAARSGLAAEDVGA
jgi:hypothetical protein